MPLRDKERDNDFDFATLLMHVARFALGCAASQAWVFILSASENRFITRMVLQSVVAKKGVGPGGGSKPLQTGIGIEGCPFENYDRVDDHRHDIPRRCEPVCCHLLRPRIGLTGESQ